MSRKLRVRVEAVLTYAKAREDSTCSMVLTYPDLDWCWTVIPAGDKHVAMTSETDDIVHRYCLPCARVVFRWPW